MLGIGPHSSCRSNAERDRERNMTVGSVLGAVTVKRAQWRLSWPTVYAHNFSFVPRHLAQLPPHDR